MTCPYFSDGVYIYFSDPVENIKYFAGSKSWLLRAQIIMALKSISTGNYGGLCAPKNKIMVIKDVGVE